MIGGVVTIIVLLFSQINQSPELPTNATIEGLLSKDIIAYSVTPDWVITTSNTGTITVYAIDDHTRIATYDIPN